MGPDQHHRDDRDAAAATVSAGAADNRAGPLFQTNQNTNTQNVITIAADCAGMPNIDATKNANQHASQHAARQPIADRLREQRSAKHDAPPPTAECCRECRARRDVAPPGSVRCPALGMM